jgi:ankyrin repeat protein
MRKVTIIFITTLSLLTVSCDNRPRLDKLLTRAAEQGDTNTIQKYLDADGDVNRPIQYVPYDILTAPMLCVAIQNGKDDMVRFLLSKKANPDQEADRFTPLMWAIGLSTAPEEKRIEILRILLNANANPNLCSTAEAESTPLEFAAVFGDMEAARVLLAAGAKVDGTDNDGQTPIHYAETAEMARLLIAAGANPTNREAGETPADSARRLGHIDALRVLTNAVQAGRP